VELVAGEVTAITGGAQEAVVASTDPSDLEETIVRIRSAGLVALVAIGIATACGGGGSSASTSPGGGNTAAVVLAVLAGDAQTGVVGQAIATAPAITATRSGQPASGVVVTFAVASGGGSVTGGTATTDASGVARAGGWTLGTTIGANTLTASATTATAVTFSATARAGAAAAISKVAGDAQIAAAGFTLGTKQAVKLVDQFGNVVSGVNVTYAVATGGGSVIGAAQVTGTDGVATVGSWTLGNVAGANTLTATATGSGITGSPLTFSATGVAGPVATLTKVAGDLQTVAVSAAVPILPAVRLADQFGNLVAGLPLSFAVASGGGTVSGATPTSGSNGVATVGGWTLGAAAGANTLTASSGGGALTVTFTATATAVFNASQYAGNYAGTWTNTTFGSTGTGSATVTVNGTASTASIVVAVTGQVLGTGGVNTTQNGPYTTNGASITNTVIPVMGSVTASIDMGGNITASGTNVPNASISRWDASGTVTSTQLRMTFTVSFADGSKAVGTIALNHL
jgi:adhesin/invasin